MLQAIGLVLTFSIAVAVSWWVSGLPGHVSASVSGVSFDASAPVAIAVLAAFVLAVHLLLRLLGGIAHLPGRLLGWKARRRRGSGDEAVSQTLVALAAGDAGEALHEAERARRLLGDTPQTLLLAAEAHRLAGDPDAAEQIYDTMADRPDAAFLGLRGLFRQALAREEWENAARIARCAEETHPGGTWLRAEREQLAVRIGDWSEALALAGPDAPVADFATAAAQAEADPVSALRLAARAWKSDPGLTPAALAYARLLRQAGREKRALEAVRQAWSANPHPDLAEFALEPVTNPLDRVKAATLLAERNKAHVESHFLLARETLAAGLTGEARRHAEDARRAGLAQKRLWLLMADIEVQDRGETEVGRMAQRDALRKAAAAEPDSAWRCEGCGTVQAGWLPACPACQAAGRIRWGGATRLVLPGAK